ncbi:MAG: RecX family transcriptional regulator [Thermodesulfovibrionales bacterium]|nr:RecX family transcriptional regulator [Thermodesulfovibrionales bacterium]
MNEKTALQYTYRLLSLKDRGSEELRQKLIQKGYNVDIANTVIAKLKDYGYIDDNKFAYKLLRYAINDKFYGKNLIKHFLISKGIDKSIVENIELSDKDFEDSAMRYITKKQKTLKSLTREEQIKRIIRSLQSKGHDYETIKKVLSIGEYNG